MMVLLFIYHSLQKKKTVGSDEQTRTA